MPIVALAALVGWFMVIWRVPHVRLASTQAKFTFATLVFFSLAATFSVPAVGQWSDAVFRLPGTRLILPYTLALLAVAMWALACVYLEPSLKPRSWMAGLAPVVWAAMLLIWVIYLPELGFPDSVKESDGGLLLNTLLHVYSFAVVAAIALPALSRRIEREPVPSTRLRLGFILATQIILGIWLGARMLLSPLIFAGLVPRSYSFGFVSFLIALMIVAYSLSLLPPRYFAPLVNGAERFRQWRELHRATKVERHAARLLSQPALELPATEILATPDFALYRVVIAILDRRKALRQAPSLSARRLAWQLDEATKGTTSYPELVAQLSKIKLKGG